MPLSNRRKFLRQTFLGSIALSSAHLFGKPVAPFVVSREVEAQLEFCSPHEFLILRAVADRIIGDPPPGAPSAGGIQAALRADKFLAAADPEIQNQFHQLLTVFNAPFFTFLFDFRFSSFLNMSKEDQDSYLEDWMTSPLGFRRTAFQGLKRVCLGVFYTDPRSWEEIGFDGEFSPDEHGHSR